MSVAYLKVWYFLCSASAAMNIASVPAVGRGKVLLFRHALAPGGGDPVNFKVDDCSTQRNLDSVGRDQAKSLGASMRAAGLSFSAVYSSPWCRCFETATLMDMGSTQRTDALGSFYEGIVDKDSTMNLLYQHLNAIDPAALPQLMVCHYVNIQTLTGKAVPSGGAVLYDPVAKTTEDVSMEIDLSLLATTTAISTTSKTRADRDATTTTAVTNFAEHCPASLSGSQNLVCMIIAVWALAWTLH